MKNLKFLPLFLTLTLILSFFCISCASAVSSPSISSPNAILIDSESGTILFAKNADSKVYPASTTKIMTVLLAVEAIESGAVGENDMVTASVTSLQGLSELGSTAGIKAGETMTLRQLLLCAMLSSANEACNIIGEYLGGTLNDFLDTMNARAEKLGCTGTHFANTHGLPNLDHYTTPEDLARIAREAIRHPLFMEICSTAKADIPATNKSEKRSLNNSNALICSSSMYGKDYVYDGAYGIKTGHTSAAGYCLASAAKRNNVGLIALVFGASTSDTCFKDTTTLLNWAFANYSYQDILKTTDCVSTVPVLSDGELDYVELCPVTNFSLLLPNDCDLSEFACSVTVYGTDDRGTLAGPITPGAVLGKVQLLKNGEDFGSVDLVPISSSVLIMDTRSGEVLYSKGIDNRVYPADTTKIMTALLAVEAVESGRVSMNDFVTATEALSIDLTPESSLTGIQPGEMLTLESLLYCAMLASGDDACNVIAEYIDGSVPAFVGHMNQRATELGCTATSFTNTHGAYNDGHFTTARDFVCIAQEASRHSLLMKICNTVVVELDATNLSPSRVLKNTNALLCDESVYGGSYLYEGASGLKTGYNQNAGYALVSTASRDGINLLCTVFGGVKDDSGFSCFTDTIALYDQIFEHYSYQEVLKSTENIASVDILLGSNANYVNLRPNDSIIILLPNDCDLSEFSKEIRVYALESGKPVTAPITAGEVLGEVTLKRGSRDYGTVKLVASATVELSRIQYIKSQLQETTQKKNFRITVICLALLFVMYLIWVLIYRIKRLRHKHAVRVAERERKAALEVRNTVPPAEPDISFFPSAENGPPIPIEEPAEAPVSIETDKVSSAVSDNPQPPLSAEEDLLAQAICVAELEPDPEFHEETPEEKAERDYFEEFFRPKK